MTCNQRKSYGRQSLPEMEESQPQSIGSSMLDVSLVIAVVLALRMIHQLHQTLSILNLLPIPLPDRFSFFKVVFSFRYFPNDDAPSLPISFS
mmetsp:Transcript_39169/g.123480  ORF Transcript_39169/g.123480 Transcript_39169/m.123480 type:complete len:92 (+) Transcript_39169:514-789(+)